MVRYKESFDSTGDNPMNESFTISAKKITMGTGDTSGGNRWMRTTNGRTRGTR